MKKFFGVVVVSLLLFCLVGCSFQKNDDVKIGVETMNLEIGGYTFAVDLESNATVAKLLDLLPLAIKMQELNGNEKYYFLDGSLPTNAVRVSQIKTGDVMLWQDNCLVIFYQGFATPYAYTKIGHINDTTNLRQAVGAGSIQVNWNQDSRS